MEDKVDADEAGIDEVEVENQFLIDGDEFDVSSAAPIYYINE